MEFVELERITGEAIGNAIIKFYNDVGVELSAESNIMIALQVFSLRKKCSVVCS